MNWKMLLADISKRTTKKSVCSALIIAGIIFALCTFVAIKDRGKEEVTKDEMMTEDAIWQEKSETVATQNQVMDLAEPCPDEGEDEKTLLKEQYDSLRRDYNTAVSEANREIRILSDGTLWEAQAAR